jgi:general secretion pathway protein H
MRMPSPTRHAGGFTLLEILLVLVILGIAAVAAAPSLGWVGAARRDDAVEQLRLALEQAVFESMLGGQQLVFVSSGDAYHFERRGDEGVWALTEADGPLRARALPDAVRIEAAWQDSQAQRGQPRLSFAGSAPPLFRLRLRAGGQLVQLQSTPSGAVTQYTLDGHAP